MNLCTRLKGKILKGAMPWHHRYIGNPLITWFLNRFYKVGVSDSQCGFRAFTRQALEKLKLEATGMEFATDMLIKARHASLIIAEAPITYYPRAEGAPSKLKSFRDGWRHVEYILTYTPKHLYLYPGLALTTLGIALMAIALINAQIGYSSGIHTSITGGMATIIGYNLLLLGAIADLTLAKRLSLQPHPITQELMKFTPDKVGNRCYTNNFWIYLLSCADNVLDKERISSTTATWRKHGCINHDSAGFSSYTERIGIKKRILLNDVE